MMAGSIRNRNVSRLDKDQSSGGYETKAPATPGRSGCVLDLDQYSEPVLMTGCVCRSLHNTVSRFETI
jgi:hypothetical protein